MINHIRNIAVDLFLSTLKASAKVAGTFWMMITVQVGEEVKPLLLAGTAQSQIEDGQVIAILNPDVALIDQIRPGCGYHAPLLKEMVSQRCDAMVNVWIDAYKKQGVSTIAKYVARTPKPAKFNVR